MNSGYNRLLLCLVQMKVFSTLHFFFYKTEYNKKKRSDCNFHFKQTKFHQETFLSCLVQQIFFCSKMSKEGDGKSSFGGLTNRNNLSFPCQVFTQAMQGEHQTHDSSPPSNEPPPPLHFFPKDLQLRQSYDGVF